MGSELGVTLIPQSPALRHGVDEEAETLRTDFTFRWFNHQEDQIPHAQPPLRDR